MWVGGRTRLPPDTPGVASGAMPTTSSNSTPAITASGQVKRAYAVRGGARSSVGAFLVPRVGRAPARGGRRGRRRRGPPVGRGWLGHRRLRSAVAGSRADRGCSFAGDGAHQREAELQHSTDRDRWRRPDERPRGCYRSQPCLLRQDTGAKARGNAADERPPDAAAATRASHQSADLGKQAEDEAARGRATDGRRKGAAPRDVDPRAQAAAATAGQGDVIEADAETRVILQRGYAAPGRPLRPARGRLEL